MRLPRPSLVVDAAARGGGAADDEGGTARNKTTQIKLRKGTRRLDNDELDSN